MEADRLDSLAIFGGAPAFSEPLHVGRPNLGDLERFRSRLHEMLDRFWFTNNGPLVQEFEQRVADIANTEECVATCNGTVALELVTRALDMSGEVIVPSFTFVATAHALQWQGIRPIFADVDEKSLTLDPKRVEELITPQTGGIIGVHLWGHGCDTAGLQDVAERNGLPIIFDAAHAFGCSHEGRPIGSFGNAEVFSFHATKSIHAFEGGAIVTGDRELAAKLRLMRNFGFHGSDNVIYVGTNGKMSEIHAAMGLTSIEAMDDITDVNRRNYRRYFETLDFVDGISIIPHPEHEAFNHHYVIALVDNEVGLRRDELIQLLRSENVLARRYFYPGVHRMEPYRSLQPMAHLVLPVTEDVSERVMVLPTGQAVSEDSVDTISAILALAQANPDAVREQLARAEQGQP